MLHFVYSLFFRLALPFVLLRLWWVGWRNPEAWTGWQERLGYVEQSSEPVIWVHAVSVGETIAAAPLVNDLLRRNPDTPVLMTAMTLTGSTRAKAIFGDRVRYAYSPYDTPGAVRRFSERVRPKALLIMETELWPNTIADTAGHGVPIFLINARLSERSSRGYQRVASLTRPLLRSIHWIAAQTKEDARHFLQIGARPETVTVTGSLKFDVDISAQLRKDAADLRKQLGETRRVWIAASTHEGEDRQILQSHRMVLQQFPDALLVIVPRHPERFDDVAELTESQGLNLLRRSRATGPVPEGVQVYLGDTMGELLMLYGASDIAFIGGSFVERGGHNPLEPAAWGMPVLSGPHIFNFETIYNHLNAGDGMYLTPTPGALAERVVVLLADPASAKQMGGNALAVVEANRGALETVVDGIAARMNQWGQSH